MIKRFEGEEGKRPLIEALKMCLLIEHDEALAKKLAGVGNLMALKRDETLITQGDTENDIYFILSGEANVLVNGRHVAIRKEYDSVGEMALTSPTDTRSATVIARSDLVVLKVTEPDFRVLADEHSHVWRSVARIVSERLRQRASILNAPNSNPVLFLGCSAESLKIAQTIQRGLKHANITVRIWTDGVFGASEIPVDALLAAVNEADFAAFVFNPDDKVESRNTEYDAPRDNTIFELGLFMGNLDRDRTFIIKEHHTDVKIPTDLLGITAVTYVNNPSEDPMTMLGPVCTELQETIEKLGTR